MIYKNMIVVWISRKTKGNELASSATTESLKESLRELPQREASESSLREKLSKRILPSESSLRGMLSEGSVPSASSLALCQKLSLGKLHQRKPL